MLRRLRKAWRELKDFTFWFRCPVCYSRELNERVESARLEKEKSRKDLEEARKGTRDLLQAYWNRYGMPEYIREYLRENA